MKVQINIDKNIFKGSKKGFRLAFLTQTNGVIFSQTLYNDFETAYAASQNIMTTSEILILYFDGQGDIKVVL